MSSFLDRLADIPIGLLPGSVPDAPTVAVPPVKTPKREREPEALALTGRQLILEAAQDLKALVRDIGRLVALQESSGKRYLNSGSLPSGGTIGTAAVKLLDPNLNRRGLSVQNIGSAGNLTLGLGINAPQANTGITLTPGQSWDGRVSGQMWRGSVTIIGSAAGVVYTSLEV